MILPLKDRVKELLEQSERCRVLIVGDLMLDRFIFGEVERISPEAPVPVVRVDREIAMPGGAANVAINIAALGGQAVLAGITGNDAAARDLHDVMGKWGIELDGVVEDESFTTIVKTRVIADRQQVCRVDREDVHPVAEDVIVKLKKRVASLVDSVDAVIIEDYGKGCIEQSLVDAVLEMSAAAGKPVTFDPKDNHHLQIRGVRLATPNLKEACAATGVAVRDPVLNGKLTTEMESVGTTLLDRWQADMVCITLGPHGMSLFSHSEDSAHVPTQAREVFDVSGAGDTVIAAATLFLAAGATGREAAALANGAAGVVVGKVGTATCSADELLAVIPSGGA